MFRRNTGNPVLSEKVFQRDIAEGTGYMTLQGTINKTMLLFLLLLLAASYSWSKFVPAGDGTISAGGTSLMLVGVIGGFILALITVFRPRLSGYTAPLYAVFEGLFLGGISALLETRFAGQNLVIRAVALTLGVFFAMLFFYRTGIIRVTNKFRLGVVAATAGIALVYFFSFILSLFGVGTSFLYGTSSLAIGISLFIIAIAALNLVLDFDFIERAVKSGAPKYMEWYGGFGLMVTLVWLYIEILRLLARFAGRD
ncbi:MAG: Bax inhibitor-1/YccA family protein [Chlorobi bacterium]|nr:Bax inhibitor-1/YccA family protein [Chlorobiota bacterium]